jgi:DMSO/TMAO reductase YedYZ molybdopterin-dependent catalytic subunit
VSGALLLAIGLKLRRAVPRAIRARRRLRLSVASAVTVSALVSLVGGWAWVAAGRPLWVGPWTVLTIHAWAGLVLVPLIAIHLLPRRWRILRAGPRAIPDAGRRLLSRRAFLGALGFSGVAVAGYGAMDLVDRALGGERRFTGSRPLPPGGIPPTTTFLGEAVPAIDLETWSVRVHGRVAQDRAWSLAELTSLGEAETIATLDCTSGWAMTTSWRGVRLSSLLEAAGWAPGSALVVRSVTGWRPRLTSGEASQALLATAVAGRSLPDENGAPCRLVAPSRRGVDWVKWVAEIEVT